MSWLYSHREQLDSYQLYAEIAYRFRPKVLPADRDDIEVEITLKLKTEADRHTEVTMGFLYAVARNIVRTYWRKKYRERRRFCALYQGDKGETSKYNWSDAGKIERMRQLYIEEDLSCAEVAKIVGKARSTVQRQLKKLGLIRKSG